MHFSPVKLLKKVFGFGEARPPEYVRPEHERALLQLMSQMALQGTYNWFEQRMKLAINRNERYREMREMDEDDMVARALNLIVSDATMMNLDTQKSIWVHARNDTVQRILDDLFERINVEDILFGLARSLALLGDHFEGLVQEKTEKDTAGPIIDLIEVNPESIERVKDRVGRLAGFRRVMVGGPSGESAPVQDDQIASPWEYVHWRLLGRRRNTDYGWPLFAHARLAFKRLRLAEDSMLLYRVKRMPDRLVFKVKGLEGLSPQDRFRFLNALANYMHKKMGMDKESGRVQGELNPMAVDDWLFIDADTLDIDSLRGGGVVGQIYDIEHFRRRLCGALGVPADYMGFPEAKGGFIARSTLSDQDIQLARECRRLQRAVIVGFIRLCMIELAWRGLDPKLSEHEFTVHMNPVSYLDELQRAEMLRVRVESINALEGIVAKLKPIIDKNRWITFLFQYAGLPRDLLKQVDEEATSAGLQGDIEVSPLSEEATILKRFAQTKTASELLYEIANPAYVSSRDVHPDGPLPLSGSGESKGPVLTESSANIIAEHNDRLNSIEAGVPSAPSESQLVLNETVKRLGGK